MSTTDLLGMDLVSCQDFVAQIRDERIILEQEIGTAASAVQTADWHGEDADAYRRTALTATGVMMSELGELMEEFALLLEAQIDEQVVASAVRTAPGLAASGTLSAALLQSAPAATSGHGSWNSRGPYDPRFFHNPWDPIYAARVAAAWPIRAQALLEMELNIAEMRAAGVHPVLIDEYRRMAEAAAELEYLHITGARDASSMELAAAQALPEVTRGLVWHEHVTGKALNKLHSAGYTDYIPSDAPREVLEVSTTEGGAAPADVEDLAQMNQATRTTNPRLAYQQSTITVTHLKDQSGQDVFMVSIPPTEGGGISTTNLLSQQPGPSSWGSNGYLALDQDTASKRAVQQALDAANIPPGATLMLQGHSQGGLVAGRLAEDPAFNGPGAYRVTDVITYGSPVDPVVPAVTGTQIHSIQHEAVQAQSSPSSFPVSPPGGFPYIGHRPAGPPVGGTDWISDLDLDQVRNPQVSQVELPGYSASNPLESLRKNHDLMPPAGASTPSGYIESIRNHKDSDPGLLAIQDRIEGTYVGPDVTVVKETEVTIGIPPNGPPRTGAGVPVAPAHPEVDSGSEYS